MKKKRTWYCLITLIIFCVLLIVNKYSSYTRRIGDTRFYLIELMTMSKKGKPLIGLAYNPVPANSGYYGGMTPGYPTIILWNKHYLVSKNYDGNSPNIVEYVIINLDSINPNDGYMTDIKRFNNAEDYYEYLRQINLSEKDMNKTDNHIMWYQSLFD